MKLYIFLAVLLCMFVCFSTTCCFSWLSDSYFETYYDYYQVNRDLLLFFFSQNFCMLFTFFFFFLITKTAVWALKIRKKLPVRLYQAVRLCRLYIRIVPFCLLYLALQIMLYVVVIDLRLLKDFNIC